MTILDDILAYKKEEVALAKANTPTSAIEALARDVSPPRGFKDALSRKAETGVALIAEIKKASPSKGIIREDFNPVAHARAYEAGGATCLSVLTDAPSFQGSPDYLRVARDAVRLPVLRKDFMIDPYQVVEARAWGADCILLIMACLETALAAELNSAATDLGMDVLVEVHDSVELENALQLNPTLIGVNNRNLSTFQTSLQRTVELVQNVPPTTLLVSESGINTPEDIQLLRDNGAKAFLVGESLMRQDNIEAATKHLIGDSATYMA